FLRSTLVNMLMYSFLILMSELYSLSRFSPHKHAYVRMFIGIDWVFPQFEQVFVEGNHLSILISCFPCSFSLYCKKDVNIPHPLSATFLPNFIACYIPIISKSSLLTES